MIAKIYLQSIYLHAKTKGFTIYYISTAFKTTSYVHKRIN